MSANPAPKPAHSLADHAAHGHRSTLVTQVIRVLCKAIGVVVLARLVSPADHGLYAMAASVTLLLWMFRDLGLGTAIIQTSQLNENLCTALVRTQGVIGVVIALITLAVAPLAAWFYQETTLVPLLAVMSVSFVFIGLGGFPRALLIRELRFHELNRLDTIAAVAATTAMVATASFGAGPYAFVAFLLVSEFLSAALAWRYCHWRPTAPSNTSGLRELLRTGFHLTQYHTLNFISLQIETFAVGRIFGTQPLGLYNRAGQMLNLPLQHLAEPLTQVTLSALARSTAASSDFERHTLAGAKVVAYFTLPIAAIAIAAPETLTLAVLGPRWLEAAPLLRWFGVSAAFAQTTLIAQAVAIASGRSRALAFLAMITVPLVMAAVLIGARFGTNGVARSVAITSAVLAWPRLWWRLKGSPVSVAHYLSTLRWPLTLAAALATGAVVGQRVPAPHSAAWQIIATFAAAAISGLLAAALIGPLRRELLATWEYLVRSRPAATTPPTSTAGQIDAQ